jgi:hypothetical protein
MPDSSALNVRFDLKMGTSTCMVVASVRALLSSGISTRSASRSLVPNVFLGIRQPRQLACGLCSSTHSADEYHTFERLSLSALCDTRHGGVWLEALGDALRLLVRGMSLRSRPGCIPHELNRGRRCAQDIRRVGSSGGVHFPRSLLRWSCAAAMGYLI